MSTKIHSNARHLAIGDGGERLFVTTREGHVPTMFDVDRASLLAAVSAECGVIIIDRADLPEVRQSSRRDIVVLGESDERFTTGTADDARGEALACLALAEYLDAHPPIDEADVQALADAFVAAAQHGSHGVSWPEDSAEAYARRVLATGRVQVTR